MRLVSAAFVFLLAAGAVSAQSLTSADWDGIYGGVLLGFANGDSGHINNGANTGGPSISGGSFGLTLGYNKTSASGGIVYGIEGDVSAADISGDQAPGFHNGFNCTPGPCRTNISWLATLRGRVGMASGKALVFGTAGLAVGGVEGTIPGNAFLDLGSQAQVGWTAGLGVEYQASERVSLKADILFTDLGENRYDDGALAPANGFYVDTKFTQIRLGVNFRF